MSSIAAQLSKIKSASSAAEIIQSRTESTTKKSLIYSQKDANKLDFNKLHQLATEALEELRSEQNLQLSESVEETLFSERALSCQRLNMSKAENEKIGILVKKFFSETQRYALLTSTLHMVEWLIQRFEIQHFEPDTIMWYFLPYFDQSIIFSKLCRLFTEIPDNWFWILSPYQTMGISNSNTNFSLGSVIRFCHRDENFLFNLGHQAKQSPDGPLAVLFLKLSTRCVVTCDNNEKNHENLLSKLFPFVEDGLSSGNDSYEWWKICLMVGSTIFARFSIDSKIGEEVVSKAMKSGKRFVNEQSSESSLSDAFLMFEVFIVNQEHDLSRGVSSLIKSRILKINNWFDIILKHHVALIKQKNKRLDDVFNYLSLDKDLLEIIFPKLSETNQLTDFVKDQRIKFITESDQSSQSKTTLNFTSLLSGNYQDRRKALETGTYTKNELNSYLATETDEKCLTLALTVADDVFELEVAMKQQYPKLISKKFAQRLTELDSGMEFYYSLFERTANGLNGRKFSAKNSKNSKKITEKVKQLCESEVNSDDMETDSDSSKYARLISLFLRCIKDDQTFNTDDNQLSIISIFESIPATPEASKYWIENCPKLEDTADQELTITCVDRCIQARVCKFLMEGDHEMDGFWDLILPKDKFIFSLMVNNLEKKERDLALAQFRLLDTDSSYFSIALKVITGKGVLGKKKGYKNKLLDILREKGDVLSENYLEIEADAYQSFITNEKDMVKLLTSDFQLLRSLSLRSFDKSEKIYESLGSVIDDILEKGNFDSDEFANKQVVFEYADLSNNMPVLFKLLEKSHLLSSQITEKFINSKLSTSNADTLIDMILSKSNPSHSLLKNVCKMLNSHKIGGDKIYKKVYSTKLVQGEALPENVTNYFDIIKLLKIKNFSEVIFRFVMHSFEVASLNQDMLVILQALEDIFNDDDVISKISDDVLRIDLFMKHLQNNQLPVNIHTNILKVLTFIANKRPNSVLDHVITVLTSLSTIRVNDIHSAQVCGDTLEAIIPPLFSAVDSIVITQNNEIISVTDVSARRKLLSKDGGKKATKFDIAMKISKVIAQTCKTMQKSRHRKLQVLNSMNKSLGMEFSYVLIAQLVINNNIHDATQEYMAIMNADSTVNCVKMLVASLNEGVFEKAISSDKSDKGSMNYAQFSRTIMNIVNNTLNQPEIIEKMRVMEDSSKFLSDVLDYLYSIRRSTEVDTKLEKLVLRSLQLMIILLPVNVLCNSLETISNISSVRTTLEKLAERLELVAEKRFSNNENRSNGIEVDQLIETFPQCVSILIKSVEKQFENIETVGKVDSGKKRKNNEKSVAKPAKNQSGKNKVAQLGILAIKSLISIVCTNPESNHNNILISPLLPCLMNIVTNKNLDRHVRASAMLCIAEMSQFLDNAFLPFLAKFIGVIQTFLVDFDQNQNKLTHTNEDIICYSLKSLQHLVANIGQYLSPHVAGIMLTLGNLRSRSSLIEKRLRGLENLISVHIPMRIFFPNMTNIIGQIENYASLIPLLNLTKNYIEKQPPITIKAHLDTIRTWSETVLMIRQNCIDSKHQKVCPEIESINEEIEEKFALAFTEFIKKLEESVFPQTFYKLFIWATDDFKSKPGLAYSFYHLCTVLAVQLKSTFVVTVAVQMISNIKEVLAYYSEYRVLNKKKNVLQILSKVLKLINTVSVYDRREFVKTHLFDACGEILIELIGKTVNLGFGDGDKFVKNDLSPTISSMCLALSVSSGSGAVLENMPMVGGDTKKNEVDDSLSWKNVHYKILQKN
jgi:hypothetical protein